ncbi:zinc-dependent alcohol dehydrogenase family protein [Herbaspirillum robiniae]|uniref:NAD(P)-dependent alcohol dehydrogenase n=1 Tax=Herbaspirillum robiniae TaxID=2014887 RepID=A0ABX2LT75_9BURK|nr:NAD(P)-dependent alcohol dehydrogenase [Herbaspirillum robiniae]NUU01230.1 NAD(P)-dependent alcohol dehydrogenase [Herbaspirillum robiniae]
MRALQADAFSIASLKIADVPKPQPKRGDILVRVKAASLNYRDLAILSGSYMPNLKLPYVPSSDACGVVEAVGEDVTRFKVGDRVVPVYIQGWRDGALTPEQRAGGSLGAPLTGVLQDYVVVPAEDAVAAPAYLTDAQASTLPIAALTAWTCLQQGGLQPGQSVLVQGTGGVALFAAQFARAAGARVIGLTSGDAKAALMRDLGVDTVINYRQTPEWAGAVREATGGRGVDIVVETTGSSLSQSLSAVRFNGFVGVIGFVGGMEAPLNIRQLIGPMIRMQGVVVGSRASLEAMMRMMAMHQIKPLIDSTFPLERAAEGFSRMEQGAHSGKIVISFD